ncbi:hypothetical protein FZC35_02750 [Candidatus Cytomitobacter indipagum]|uniref:Ribosome maturation factor RimM n=1 Tax=Candidatus Cytomitobacter indipagum TaxID=2601575 RepID=A0A5C0UEX3_9PROT|nr:PRC-barrel domain-containing protein [Candidatus Cytomitobacter indipagum]QEK38267.1 hypothetical protein FZC35_02750 [Candidatus Cytomitobacter indipagum]
MSDKKDISENFITIGKTIKSHGLKGHIKMHLYYENVDYDTVFIDGNELKIESINILHDNKSIIKFVDFDTIEDIERFCKKNVVTEKEDLQDNEVYCADLVGMKVCNPDGSEISVVSDVYDFGAGLILDTDLECMIAWRQVEKFDKQSKKIILKDKIVKSE